MIDKSQALRVTSILLTASTSLCALPGRHNCAIIFEVFTSIFCVLVRPRQSLHSIYFEFSLRLSYDPSWELLSCALPGWFQSCNHFSKPPPRVLVFESGNSVRSGSFVFETLVGMRTLPRSTLKNSACSLPCLFQSLDYF